LQRQKPNGVDEQEDWSRRGIQVTVVGMMHAGGIGETTIVAGASRPRCQRRQVEVVAAAGEVASAAMGMVEVGDIIKKKELRQYLVLALRLDKRHEYSCRWGQCWDEKGVMTAAPPFESRSI
jgi:hypothetical protein